MRPGDCPVPRTLLGIGVVLGERQNGRTGYERLWEANKAVAEAYGLSADDFGHVLVAIPSFARKRPGFYAYLTTKIAEWAAR